MYIYRVVPNSAVSHVTSNIALTDRAFVGAEDIYYNLGYTSFIKEKNCKNKNWNSTINTLNTSGSGKYFFLFPEDAIIHSHDIINSFGQKRGCTFSLLVYDIPVDIVLSNIGYGIYGEDGDQKLVETFISIDKFGNSILDSSIIDEKTKLKELIKVFKIIFHKERLYMEYNSPTLCDYMFELNDFDLPSHIDDDEYMESLIKHSRLYNNLQICNGRIVKSGYIINKNIPINSYENVHYLCKDELDITDILSENNFRPTLYSEIEKREILELLNKSDIERNKIKSLLK